jgi:hypothetical protein
MLERRMLGLRMPGTPVPRMLGTPVPRMLGLRMLGQRMLGLRMLARMRLAQKRLGRRRLERLGLRRLEPQKRRPQMPGRKRLYVFLHVLLSEMPVLYFEVLLVDQMVSKLQMRE